MISFGSVTHRNLKGDLRNVANVAQSSQNQNVRVQVLRNGKVRNYIQKCEVILVSTGMCPIHSIINP